MAGVKVASATALGREAPTYVSHALRLAQLSENDKPILVYSTFPSLTEAERAAERLVAAQLAACVNILPGMVSVYRWEGCIEKAEEVVAIFKTRESLSQEVIGGIRSGHPYTTPAILVVPVDDGAPDYIGWLMDMTKRPA
jgi:periplasmic divalent cation tolerance protein